MATDYALQLNEDKPQEQIDREDREMLCGQCDRPIADGEPLSRGLYRATDDQLLCCASCYRDITEPARLNAFASRPLPEEDDAWFKQMCRSCAHCARPFRLFMGGNPAHPHINCSRKCERARALKQKRIGPYTGDCWTCGESFEAKWNARYCSNRCRQAAHRKRASA